MLKRRGGMVKHSSGLIADLFQRPSLGKNLINFLGDGAAKVFIKKRCQVPRSALKIDGENSFAPEKTGHTPDGFLLPDHGRVELGLSRFFLVRRFFRSAKTNPKARKFSSGAV